MSKILASYIAFWKRAFDFSGRTSRAEYWYAIIGHILASIVLSFFLGILSVIFGNESFIVTVISGLYSLVLLIPSISFGVRRLHDIGFSGLLYLINFTGIGAFVLLVLACMKGQPGANKYGMSNDF